MPRDVLAQMGYLALGSRLKRLAERMQADAAKAFSDRSIPVQATHFPLLAALITYGPMSVTEAVEAVGISQPAQLVDIDVSRTGFREAHRSGQFERRAR